MTQIWKCELNDQGKKILRGVDSLSKVTMLLNPVLDKQIKVGDTVTINVDGTATTITSDKQED